MEELIAKCKVMIDSIRGFQELYKKLLDKHGLDFHLENLRYDETMLHDINYACRYMNENSLNNFFSQVINDKIFQLKHDYDWQEIFERFVNPVQNGDNPIHEPLKYPTKLDMDWLEKIIAISNGENDGASWLGVFKLKWNKGYLMVRGWCDYTGWDCQAEGDAQLAQDLNNLIRFSITPEERRRLGLVLDESNEGDRTEENK